MRMGAFKRRKATYSVYPREEFSKTPTLFKFTMMYGKLEMTFNDLMTGEICRLGCEREESDVEIWLQRVDIAEGVDAVMVILLCVGVHDSELERKWKTSPDKVVDVNNHETLFLIQQKSMSLHKQRTLLDARNQLPVATLRLSMFNRTPTYSAYPRTEHEETPYAFKFTADETTVRSEFVDLVGGQPCVIGCDPSNDGSDALSFWLVRGVGDTADVQQTIAHLTYTHKSPKTSLEQSVVLDVAPGVDRMMMILICIGLLDEGFEDEHTHPE
ncbi:hypothetical protein BBO99_00003696 [Phytophthora kernoviae]|uniref:Tubby C-terminal domain-containing protein n=2 Tax=Phytophthora kernoviae TaxID=325452 RepID=A0A3R7JVI0_9STRA|nr:hypothetical protein G195_005224 [Phytophthora kernoviae 00238/432]KAG2523875.1 hypothetical protein JM16_003201 [Phytophthora kernoviae]KAG2525693.1 hypothetical protein JM18_003071 [Phytophthora kernoviae]RLN02579.1 hypothetical protein BBI17_003420 [Phytophthora kernoviae]RLN81441.1 hypothetical protein BBO99_00003696 [Phytophthora kernoviae]